MIDGWPEAFEQELMSYLLAQQCTTPAQFADHFHLSERSAAYWLGCLVKSGKVQIARIERRDGELSNVTIAPAQPQGEDEKHCWPRAVFHVSRAFDAA